jgi:site-specific DNA-methyltransferase (adenine-specific)
LTNFEIYTGNVSETIDQIEDGSINCTITSPPYFGLRKYSDKHESEIGKEKLLEDYIANLKEVFRKTWLKTRDDGTLFLNLGDSYIDNQLQGVPWRVALALAEVGWVLRSDIIWKKPNAMPSSIKNRFTVEHEYVFFFSKMKKGYNFYQDAVREPHVTFSENSKMKGGRNHLGKRGGTPEKGKNSGNPNLHNGRWDQAFHPLGRNKRTVWEIPLSKFRGAHFAVFPEKLVEICINSATIEGDLVFDPFTGSGTTGVVSIRNGRNFVGCELVEEYAEMARERIANEEGLF